VWQNIRLLRTCVRVSPASPPHYRRPGAAENPSTPPAPSPFHHHLPAAAGGADQEPVRVPGQRRWVLRFLAPFTGSREARSGPSAMVRWWSGGADLALARPDLALHWSEGGVAPSPAQCRGGAVAACPGARGCGSTVACSHCDSD
jgi:hypothetical protein